MTKENINELFARFLKTPEGAISGEALRRAYFDYEQAGLQITKMADRLYMGFSHGSSKLAEHLKLNPACVPYTHHRKNPDGGEWARKKWNEIAKKVSEA